MDRMDSHNINPNISGSRTVTRAAIMIALTRSRDEEREMKAQFAAEEVRAAAVDYGGEFITSIMRIVERAVVAAKREGVISSTEYREEGSVAGATREALSQVTNKAIGLNVGGKIGIARSGNNVAVAVFFGIGLLHLNEVAVGVGHRAI